jgi:cardiolipin synthase A/B
VTPYYIPDKNFLKLVATAARRGVKVKVVLPERPDSWLLHQIAQVYYDVTVRAGAAIFFTKKFNHAKTFLVDNKLGVVGSNNFTPRGFFMNEESGAYFTDEAMVAELNTIYDRWIKDSYPYVSLGARGRNLCRRIKNWFFKFFGDHL